MSQLFAAAQANSMAFGERKKTIGAKSTSSAKERKITLNLFLVVLICAAGLLYIFEVNNSATYGYKITNLEKQIEELSEKNEDLKMKEAELRSIYNIEEKTKNLNMTAPKDVSYISLPGNMAMK